MKVHYSLR